jgi:hypothetical protein
MNGLADAQIGSATAQVPAASGLDVVDARVRVRLQQRGSCHDVPGSAIRALTAVCRYPSRVQRCHDGVAGGDLRRRNAVAHCPYGHDRAGLVWDTIYQHGARATLHPVARPLGRDQAQRISEHIDEHVSRLDGDTDVLVIDVKSDCPGSSWICW